MKFKFKVLLTIFLAFIISMFNNRYLFARERVDIFDEILSNRNIAVSKYSVTGTFKSSLSENGLVKDILQRTCTILGNVEYTVEYNNEFINISFVSEEYEGSINSTPYYGENIITVTIIKEDNENNTKELQGKLSEILSHINSRITYSQSIKGKILNNNLEEINKFVLDILDENKAKNINTAKLHNGYSTISNTNFYESKKVGNMDIDFHYAVVKYSSGCYLIMGTPEITLDY